MQKLIKQRRDSLEIFKNQNREDLATKEQEEITIIEKFLPQQLTSEELKSQLAENYFTIRSRFSCRHGKGDGRCNETICRKAEGKAVSAAVKELLSK